MKPIEVNITYSEKVYGYTKDELLTDFYMPYWGTLLEAYKYPHTKELKQLVHKVARHRRYLAALKELSSEEYTSLHLKPLTKAVRTVYYEEVGNMVYEVDHILDKKKAEKETSRRQELIKEYKLNAYLGVL